MVVHPNLVVLRPWSTKIRLLKTCFWFYTILLWNFSKTSYLKPTFEFPLKSTTRTFQELSCEGKDGYKMHGGYHAKYFIKILSTNKAVLGGLWATQKVRIIFHFPIRQVNIGEFYSTASTSSCLTWKYFFALKQGICLPTHAMMIFLPDALDRLVLNLKGTDTLAREIIVSNLVQASLIFKSELNTDSKYLICLVTL